VEALHYRPKEAPAARPRGRLQCFLTRAGKLYRDVPPMLALRSALALWRTKVQKQPVLKYIDVALDYACNMRCEHCFAAALRRGGQRRLSVDEWRRVASEALRLGLLHVNLQGGEPLVLESLPEYVRVFMPDRCWISVTTNGLLVTDRKVRRLKNAGVRQLILSMDSLSPEGHDAFRRSNGALNAVLRALHTARAHGLAVSVNVTVSRTSLESPGQQALFEWLRKNRIPYNPIVACPVGAWAGRYEVMLDSRQKQALRAQVRRDRLGQRDMDAAWVKWGCPATAEQVYLTPYGDVLPCPFIQISLGNVRKQPLRRIWSEALRRGYFGRYAPACWVGENRSFAEALNRVTGARKLPVPVDEAPAREVLERFWKDGGE